MNILPQCAGLSRPRSKGLFTARRVEKEIASFYTYFVYELYCNTSEWGHGKKLELRPRRGFLLVVVEKFHSFLIYILMS